MQRLVFLKATCIDLPRYSPNNGKLRLQRSPSSRADERCTNSRPMCLEVRQLRELQLEESPKDPKQVDFFARSAGACRAESPRALGGRPGLRTRRTPEPGPSQFFLRWAIWSEWLQACTGRSDPCMVACNKRQQEPFHTSVSSSCGLDSPRLSHYRTMIGLSATNPP